MVSELCSEEANEFQVVEAALSLARQAYRRAKMVKYARDPDNSTKSCKVAHTALPVSRELELAVKQRHQQQVVLLNCLCSCRPGVPIFACISRTLENPQWH